MEGGTALFLLFIIIVVGVALAFMFTWLGGWVQVHNERRGGRKRRRPTHVVASDDGTSTAKPGDRLPE